jgi:hypothetical protein
VLSAWLTALSDSKRSVADERRYRNGQRRTGNLSGPPSAGAVSYDKETRDEQSFCEELRFLFRGLIANGCA